jgi:hypothetical protein
LSNGHEQQFKKERKFMIIEKYCKPTHISGQIILIDELFAHDAAHLLHILPHFPPNDRAQNHAQENPLLVLFLLAQKCLWTLKVRKCVKKTILF